MNKIVYMKFGSHLYGTDTPESDLDYKGIYLPEKVDTDFWDEFIYKTIERELK